MLGGMNLLVTILVAVEIVGTLYGAFLEARDEPLLDVFDLAFAVVTNIFFWPLTVGVHLINLHNRTRED